MTSNPPINKAFRLSSPTIFLVRMAVFLVLAGFVAFILQEQIGVAFMANPGLNGLILAVEAFGILLAIAQVVRLYREIAWVNARAEGGYALEPRLLAPMRRMLGGRGSGAISTHLLRTVLDSVATRLDESRETLRYLTGLLVFLGLLGTFWGLLQTVGSISGVINSLQAGGESTALFNDLKSGLARPLAGMSLSFTSSLFGLAGSLVLGFLDLQAGHAQNRFYTELEDLLSAAVDPEFFAGAEEGTIAPSAAKSEPSTPDSTQAMADLADGVQNLVTHMRAEQQMIRDWVEAQAAQQAKLQATLAKLAETAQTPEHR